MTHKCVASLYDNPSSVVNIDTPKANVNEPNPTNPPGTEFCQLDAKSNNGPQKNPNPRSGSNVKNIRPSTPVSPGHISPNPILGKKEEEEEEESKLDRR